MSGVRWTENELKKHIQKQSIKAIENQKKNSCKVSKSTRTKIIDSTPIGLSENGIDSMGSIPPFKKNKFNAKKMEVDGIVFDSKKEAGRYVDLKNQQQAGLIKGLRHQYEYELRVNDQLICRYVSDFVYLENGQMIVEDVKSASTRKLPVYQLKKKLMKAIHGIEIKEV